MSRLASSLPGVGLRRPAPARGIRAAAVWLRSLLGTFHPGGGSSLLDAVLEKALSGRERDLLATVPALLARRFAQLYEAHQARLAEAQTEDDPGQWMQAGGWLAAFCADLRTVLLAELELRLQPVAGLLAALDKEVTRKQ